MRLFVLWYSVSLSLCRWWNTGDINKQKILCFGFLLLLDKLIHWDFVTRDSSMIEVGSMGLSKRFLFQIAVLPKRCLHKNYIFMVQLFESELTLASDSTPLIDRKVVLELWHYLHCQIPFFQMKQANKDWL